MKFDHRLDRAIRAYNDNKKISNGPFVINGHYSRKMERAAKAVLKQAERVNGQLRARGK